ncbi:hypothetical protein B0T26DRAFT_138784 [Lasiosphaeria miniovina]|uniref:Uncharacterized protein n=1 Tax=Lasiosphaeria miniovina TaxID=1954250 RepID=A0AA40E492_9PEZI|nr:uncharacterized protein B0T26DRAFT_138784 [Lasiosphaeria miniovina]KAK0727519.1 hypothetical protein B0T26DRAFT_138784 [Lasiosphaeria miniovina]
MTGNICLLFVSAKNGDLASSCCYSTYPKRTRQNGRDAAVVGLWGKQTASFPVHCYRRWLAPTVEELCPALYDLGRHTQHSQYDIPNRSLAHPCEVKTGHPSLAGAESDWV